jgi:hypothetical protein
MDFHAFIQEEDDEEVSVWAFINNRRVFAPLWKFMRPYSHLIFICLILQLFIAAVRIVEPMVHSLLFIMD